MDLLNFWQLRERPFETVWDARFFFRSRAHEEALHRLRYLASENTMNVGLLTGEIGCGKTLTCAVFREELDPMRYVVVSFDHVRFDFDEIVSGLLTSLEQSEPPTSNRLEMWRRLSLALENLAAAGRHLIVTFDEAQDFEPTTLRELKALTNLNGRGTASLSLVFAGQPELQHHIASVPSLAQRVTLRFHLRALARAESDAYLEHRLRVAGHMSGRLFSDAALQRIFEVSAGIPRELNRFAKLAIEHAWVNGESHIDPSAVDAVVADDARHNLLAIP